MTAKEYDTQKALGLMGEYKLRIYVRTIVNTQTIKNIVEKYTYSSRLIEPLPSSRTTEADFYDIKILKFKVKCIYDTNQIITNIIKELRKNHIPVTTSIQEIHEPHLLQVMFHK